MSKFSTPHVAVCFLDLPTSIRETMREIQFHEAVAEAMSEEMRPTGVFLMGEEVAEKRCLQGI